MGGHGGLNILPQKKWNVYNWDNRIKVMQNEKLINEELEKRNKAKNDKIFKEKINAIKNNEEFNEDIYTKEELDQKEKNRIFAEIMKTKTLEKQIDNDVYFESRLEPMKANERLSLFDEKTLKSEYEKNINKKNYDSDDYNNYNKSNKNNINGNNKEKNNSSKLIERFKNSKNLSLSKNENGEITFKDSIKNHLQPWYIKKSKDDYIKSFVKANKLFTKEKEGSESDLDLNEEEIDKNKLLKNYEDFYDRLEFDVNNRISVKDKFKGKSIIKNNQVDIDSDHLEYLKGEKNLEGFLLKKKKAEKPIENKDKVTMDDLYDLVKNGEFDKKKDKKNKKHKKEKKHKKDKKHKKEKKH